MVSLLFGWATAVTTGETFLLVTIQNNRRCKHTSRKWHFIILGLVTRAQTHNKNNEKVQLYHSLPIQILTRMSNFTIGAATSACPAFVTQPVLQQGVGFCIPLKFIFASLPETSSHLFWYVLSFLFLFFYFYAKITWLFPTSIRNGSKISFEFCWSLHTVDLWFSVNAWWLPLSGTLFIQHGWPLQHLLRRNSTVVAGSTAEFGQWTFFIPAKRNLKESDEEKVNLQRWALSLQIPVTLSNPPWPSNFWIKDNCEWELTMKCSEVLRQQGLLLILSYCFEDKRHGDSEWPTGRYHWWPSLGLLLEAVDE